MSPSISVKSALLVCASILVALSADRLLQAHNLRMAAYGLSSTCDHKELALQLALKSAELSPLFNRYLPVEIARGPGC
jgi:hypothetical protein